MNEITDDNKLKIFAFDDKGNNLCAIENDISDDIFKCYSDALELIELEDKTDIHIKNRAFNRLNQYINRKTQEVDTHIDKLLEI